MTKDKFLERCSTARDAWYINEDSLLFLRESIEYVTRKQWWQEHYLDDIRESIMKLSDWKTLANDPIGNKAFNLWYLLCHPCDKCALDKNARHTRYSFCSHNTND